MNTSWCVDAMDALAAGDPIAALGVIKARVAMRLYRAAEIGGISRAQRIRASLPLGSTRWLNLRRKRSMR